ncbi:myb family transcription factor PHL4 isoform X2 [Brassica napus]|uniref:HTH myb-type domain-containing protein n=2 Tax=Brassica TaxID=3705 RepID=A0A0D3E3M9_BRAOL|nr:PREDICTED: protein PHR1-LIKE 1-like [Brassica oleracea var. oleracea]XP_013608869.1 PREDICTED: protein PHR1-LIKE 1-like [Brassica oleracea var. oleracea]XP_022564759.1 myb family transcription factor PHL4 isoform X2 [Brassica napus]XP_048625884.1 myb family transcription factor PHL4 isoform X2 [Brassica napus]CAF1719348.1 unnamed protein product [Brassica napus]
METRNLAHTCSSIPPPDIPINSQQHNQLIAGPYHHLLSANGEAVGHIYSNDFPNAASSMVSHEMLDWDDHADLLDLGVVEEDDELITNENPIMSPFWNDVFLVASSTSAPKVHESTMQSQIQQPQVPLQHPSPCVELPPLVRTVSSNSNDNTNSTSAAAKGRMRWTPELHEAFVEAVNHLGGMNNAKPKAVLKHMKVQGLTIYHVKSHLQKYRTARYVSEPSEGSQETKLTPLEHVTSLDTKRGIDINEALRIQMEVQKQLHEQLEVQRKMQLRIEEQGKVLLMMFEKQNMDFCKPEQEDKASEKTPESCSEEADSPRPKRPRNDE